MFELYYNKIRLSAIHTIGSLFLFSTLFLSFLPVPVYLTLPLSVSFGVLLFSHATHVTDRDGPRLTSRLRVTVHLLSTIFEDRKTKFN